MTEYNQKIKLSEWCTYNGITFCNNLVFIGHRNVESVYGQLFETNKGLVFERHKWTEINKGKKIPKVCSEIQYSYKFVSDEIWNSFIKLEYSEYLSREILDSHSI